MIKFFSRQIDTNAFFQFISSLSVKSRPRFELAGQKLKFTIKKLVLLLICTVGFLRLEVISLNLLQFFIEFITILDN